MWTLLAACGTAPAPGPAPDAGCRPLFTHDLDAPVVGDGSDARVAWSPDGGRLAVVAGDRVAVLGGRDGAVVAERAFPESLLRALAWSSDGRTVWVGEQSGDAFVRALDAADLSERARYRLADDVSPSPPPDPSDPWGWYQLPAAYHLFALPAGVLAVAAHGWDTPGGRRNASRVLRLDDGPGGLSVGAAWPAEGSADAVFGAAAADDAGVAVAVRRSADGPDPAGLPIDGVARLSLPDLAPRGARTLPPLPGYAGVFVWDALAVGPAGLVFGTGDGRLATDAAVVAYATPVGAAPVPVAASVGTLRADGGEVFTVTSRSWSPGSADGSRVPASLHPEERALAAWTWTAGGLAPRWSWRGPYEWSGLALGPGEVVATAGPRADGRSDLFGLVRFPRGGTAPRAVCPTTAGATSPAVAADGRAAVIEVPAVVDGRRTGPHRVSAWW